MPVAGMWGLANPGQSPAPANTSSAFDTSYFGETRLDPHSASAMLIIVVTGVLMVGAGPGDSIKLVSGTNPGTPVGGQAPSPFTVQAVAADGVTPVAGASVQFVCSPFVAFSACSGSTNCTVLTDQSGFAS